MRTNLIKPKNISEAKSKTSNDGMLDMVIAFDTTGSMAGCIRSVKEYVTELVPKLFAVNPNLRLGVVAFGDYCDMESQHEFGKAYQVLDLTCDEHEIIEFISKAENTYGGDGSEFYELVIKKITEETSWREGSVKSVLLIADATPHNEYVYNMLNTSDQYEKEVKVTREDKKDGTPGIRTIFEGIKSSEVFTVVFKKQDKAKTKKQFESEKEAQRMEATSMIDKAKRQKKSMATAYKEALEFVQSNPIKDYTEGEDRVLRGFKIQFVSRDGKYRCMDMDIEKTEKDTGERLVNINTISQLIYNGVKYTVE